MTSIKVNLNGRKVDLTYDNTTVVLFKGEFDELDHIEIRHEDGTRSFVYEESLRRKLCELDYPVYWRADKPKWALDRFMLGQVDDLDKLLYEAG